MATFVIRVELHDATQADYAALHKAMAAAGCPQTITSSDGKLFQLPSAMYSATGNATASQVSEQVVAIAKRIKPSVWVIVSKCAITDIDWLLVPV